MQPDGRRPGPPAHEVLAGYTPVRRRTLRTPRVGPFDEKAFRAERDRILAETQKELNGGMGRVAQQDFAEATEETIRERRSAPAAPRARRSGKAFDEKAFREERERLLEKINEELGGAMGRVAREDFAEATENMVRERRGY